MNREFARNEKQDKKMNIECARIKKRYQQRKKIFFHFNYKENKESTHCYVKSRRINYAEKKERIIRVCKTKSNVHP